MQRNSFTGEVPTELYNLASLVTFFLGDNAELQGEITPDIAGLVNLEHLNLDRTGMQGLLPPEFFWNSKLEVFSAQECGFTGPMVPEQWLNFTALRELILNFNDFTGPFPNIFNDFPDLGKSDVLPRASGSLLASLTCFFLKNCCGCRVTG